MKYFKDVKTVSELRSAYVELLKKYHPDNGGSTEICQEINQEYDFLKSRLPKEESPKKDNGEARFTEKQMNDFDDLIRQKLSEIIRFSGIDIEVVGIWIWIDGNTYQWREELKNAGFTWSRSRKKWHYTPYETGSFYKRGRKYDFDTIRGLYGSEKVKTENQECIA